MEDVQVYDKGKLVIGFENKRTEFRINDKKAFNYKDFPLIYAAEPLAPFNPYALKYLNDPGPNFNIVICSADSDSGIENKCFLFPKTDMEKAKSHGLLPYLHDSFSVGSL